MHRKIHPRKKEKSAKKKIQEKNSAQNSSAKKIRHKKIHEKNSAQKKNAKKIVPKKNQ